MKISNFIAFVKKSRNELLNIIYRLHISKMVIVLAGSPEEPRSVLGLGIDKIPKWCFLTVRFIPTDSNPDHL